jgi:uncharacterized protein YndB with AHSA1/START domain
MITVQTKIGAPIEEVWECWTKPEHITEWNFASDQWHCPHAINDLKPGGTFMWRMEAKDGSMGFDFTGTYLQIEKEKFISYKMSDGRRVDIMFGKIGEFVKLSESFEAEGTNSDEQQRAGWQVILGNFKNYVESKNKYAK